MRTKSIVVLVVVVFAVCSATVQAFNMEWVTVGDAGNVGDTEVMTTDGTTGYGSVSYIYRIGKYEVTNSQYCEFLNAVAANDVHDVYEETGDNDDGGMPGTHGGIIRNGSPNSYTYEVKIGRGNWPVNYVDFYDCLRFANWLHNGQPVGEQDDSTTEDGAYDMSLASIDIHRNPDARVWLPSEDEWYKAAYYKGGDVDAGYWDYATQSDTIPTAESPPGGNNSANYNTGVLGNAIDVGSYISSVSNYGTFDQSGNVFERIEDLFGYGAQYPDNRVLRGGAWYHAAYFLPSSFRSGKYTEAYGNDATFGFRVASVGEADVVPAAIDIDPDVLNLESKGKWITCYIELPEGYDVAEIDVSTVMLNDVVPAESRPTGILDHDGDGIVELMVKFSRSAVQGILGTAEQAELTVTGELADGTLFEGADTIKIVQ